MIAASAVLLLVRLLVAIAFGFSSFNKFKNIRKTAKNNGMPVPVMTFVALAEGAGALGMASGVLAGFAALGLMVLMVGTIALHVFVWKGPYWAEKGGWEYDLMLLALSAVILVLGTGSFIV